MTTFPCPKSTIPFNINQQFFFAAVSVELCFVVFIFVKFVHHHTYSWHGQRRSKDRGSGYDMKNNNMDYTLLQHEKMINDV